jgi:hypothetical protein
MAEGLWMFLAALDHKARYISVKHVITGEEFSPLQPLSTRVYIDHTCSNSKAVVCRWDNGQCVLLQCGFACAVQGLKKVW